MTGRLDGKVAFVTGAGRGQGRAHAVRLAQDGADIIAIDICESIPACPFPLASENDLQQTAKLVEQLGRKIVATKADVRDFDQIDRAVRDGVAKLGRLDIVAANAGIFAVGNSMEMSEDAWGQMIDVNLTGVWRTVKAAYPHIVAGGRGGSVILTSSANGLVGAARFAHYVSAKHGVIGLMRALAIELGPDGIRVNSVLPGGVATDMIRDFVDIMGHDARYVPPAPEDVGGARPWMRNFLDPSDISDAVAFLASDDSRYMTGNLLQVNGMGLKAIDNAKAAGAQAA